MCHNCTEAYSRDTAAYLDVVAYPIGNYDYYLYQVRYEDGSPSDALLTMWTNAVYLDLPD